MSHAPQWRGEPHPREQLPAPHTLPLSDDDIGYADDTDPGWPHLRDWTRPYIAYALDRGDTFIASIAANGAGNRADCARYWQHVHDALMADHGYNAGLPDTPSLGTWTRHTARHQALKLWSYHVAARYACRCEYCSDVSADEIPTEREVYADGYERGRSIARGVSVQIGRTYVTDEDPRGIIADDDWTARGIAERIAFEIESNDRSYSPFEFTANALNQMADCDAVGFDPWEVYEEGIGDGIIGNIPAPLPPDYYVAHIPSHSAIDPPTIIADFLDLEDARRAAAQWLRNARRHYRVSALDTGRRWEILPRDDAAMIGDDAGALVISIHHEPDDAT